MVNRSSYRPVEERYRTDKLNLKRMFTALGTQLATNMGFAAFGAQGGTNGYQAGLARLAPQAARRVATTTPWRIEHSQ